MADYYSATAWDDSAVVATVAMATAITMASTTGLADTQHRGERRAPGQGSCFQEWSWLPLSGLSWLESIQIRLNLLSWSSDLDIGHQCSQRRNPSENVVAWNPGAIDWKGEQEKSWSFKNFPFEDCRYFWRKLRSMVTEVRGISDWWDLCHRGKSRSIAEREPGGFFIDFSYKKQLLVILLR